MIRILSWVLVMVIPGFCLYRQVARRAGRLGEAVLAGFVLSPVIVAGLAALALSTGVSSATTTQAIVIAAAGAALTVALVPGAPLAAPARRDVVIFLALVAALVFVTALLPFTHEWWRVRSDAWFHAAVVAQIDYAGVPPEDPYFAGMTLQYMWFYHVLVLVLSRVLDLDAFWPMAIINIHALAGLSLGGFYLAGVFRDRFGHRLAATAMLLFGFNAAFWVFLPLKLLRSIHGEVRGWDEIRRTFSLHPLNYERARDFMVIYYNPVFFLDKFMVATAFGVALVCMTAAWFAAASYLRDRRPESLILLAGSVIGMLGFHSLVGFIMLVGIFGGATLTWFANRRDPACRARDFLAVMAVAAASFAVMIPYLHSVMHLKEREQLFPLSVSLAKTIGIAVSCAFVLVLALRQRRFWSDRAPATRFFTFAFLSLTVFCLLIRLPGPNTYDKLGYFVFIPLAIVAGFTLADRIAARQGRRRWLSGLAWTMLFFVPVNGLALTGWFASAEERAVTVSEARLAEWVRANTPRAAVIVDDRDRVALVVAAPRRYYAGSASYAAQWGYPKLEMSRRLHARRALYASGALDATALDALAGVRDPLFVVTRAEHWTAGAAVTRRLDLFATVYNEDGLRLMRVDANACRAAAGLQSDRVSPEELIRESGL